MLQRISRTAWVIFLLWLFLYGSFALQTPSLLDGTDALHAEVAREMILRHDPMAFYANGIPYLPQAPLLYWSTAANLRLFGIATGSARLPLALYTLLLALLTGMLARRLFWSERSGLYAGVGLLLSAGLFTATRTLIPAAVVCLWSTSALYCLWRAETDPPEYSDDASLWPCLGFAAACALNVLTDGVTTLAVPALTALLYLLITRGFTGTLKRLWRLHPIRAAFVFLAIAAPWYLLTARANNESLWQALHLHPTPSHSAALALYPLLLLAMLMPWSAFLVNAMGAVPWRRALHRSTATLLDSQENALVLLTVGALLPLAVAFATRQQASLLPSLPCFILLVARWLDRECLENESLTVPSPLSDAGSRIASVLFYGGCVIALACGFFLAQTRNAEIGGDLASLIRAPGAAAFSLWHLRSINPAAIGLFHEPLQLLALAILVGTGGSWWLRRNHQPHQANIAFAIGAFGLLVAGHKAFDTVSPILSSQRLMATVAPEVHDNDLVVINGEYPAASSFGFYLQRDDIHILRSQPSNPGADTFLAETLDSLRTKWAGKGRIFLWTTPETLPSLPGNVFVLAQGGGKEILSNMAVKVKTAPNEPQPIQPAAPARPDGVDNNRFPDFQPIPALPGGTDFPPLPDLHPSPATAPNQDETVPRGAVETFPRATPPGLPRSSTPSTADQSSPAPAATTDRATPGRPAASQLPPAEPTQRVPATPN